MLGNLHNQEICKTVCSKSTEKENNIFKNDHKTEKCLSVNTTFNESDKLHTSSGYLNSDESYDTNSFKSSKYYSDYQNKDSVSESLSSETTNSISDILNANISPENQPEAFASRIYFDGSIISSVTDARSINDDDDNDDDDDDDDDDDSYISLNNIVLSETSKSNETKLSTENNTCSNNNEWMTEISEDFSSLFSTDEYFTCPDSKSEKRNVSSISSTTGITNKEM